MKDVLAPMLTERMSVEEASVLGYHIDNSGGIVQVQYDNGRKNDLHMIIDVKSEKNGYELTFDNGESYSFNHGLAQSKKTLKGRSVTVNQMENIDGRVERNKESIDVVLNEIEGARLFGSKGEKIEQGSNHEEMTNRIWDNPDATIELFDVIAENESSTDDKHTKELRKLLKEMTSNITPIFNEFKVFIDKTAKENKGMAQVTTKDSKIILELKDDSNARTDDMSGAETYMHELIHMSVEMARHERKGALSNEIQALNKLYRQAKESIKWQDLVVNGNEEAAKHQHDQMFGDGDRSISEFIALGMTNAKVKEVLSGIDAQGKPSERKTDTMWGYISHAVARMYEIIADMITAKQGLAGDEKLRWLVDRMWQHNKLTAEDASMSGKVSEYADKARTKLDDVIRDTVSTTASAIGIGADYVVEHNKENIVGQTVGTVKNIANLANPYMSEGRRLQRNKTVTELSQMMDGKNNWLGLGGILAPESTIMSMINYFSDDDSLTTKIERFGIINQKLDSNRQSSIVTVGGEIKKALGSVSKSQQQSITHALMETDAQALLSEYTVDEIKQMMTDEVFVDKLISEERANIDKLIQNQGARNYMKSQTMGLGHVMATGISGSSIQQNAYDIVTMKNVKAARPQHESADSFKELIRVVDRLASLEAIKRTDKVSKDTVSTIGKGLDTVLAMHKMYVANATSYAKTHKTNAYPNKGEVKDTKEHNMQSIVNRNDAETQKLMKDKGYKLSGESGVPGFGFYTSSIMGMQSYTKQAMAKINEAKRLHTVLAVSDTESDKAAKVKVIKRESDKDIAKQLGSVVMPNIDGYIKIGNKHNINNYGISIDKKVYAKTMRQDNKAPILLGKMVAEIGEKRQAVMLNNQVYSEIMKDMKNYKRGEADYIEIGPDAKTKGQTEKRFSDELLRNLPYNIRSRIEERAEGQQFIAIRRDLANIYVGGRSPSVLNMRIPYADKTVGDALRTTEAGNTVANAVLMAGEIWAEIVSIEKVDIVIRTPKVIIDNIISNINYSVTLGQMPWTVAANQMKMFKETKKYLDMKKEKDSLSIRVQTVELDSKLKKKMMLEIRDLDREMKSMMVHDVMKSGLFTSVVEDIHDADLTASSKFEKLIEESDFVKGVVDNTPEVVKDGLQTLYMTESTDAFKMMMMAVQYSDFVARAARYQYLVEEKGFNKDVALKMILDEFVNYNRIMPTVLRWLNELGFAWFIQYFIGSNKSLIAKVRERPSAIAAMALLLDAPNPSEADFFEKNYDYMFKNPLDVIYDGGREHILPPSSLEILGLI